MTVDTAVDFLLENLMQLINFDNKFIRLCSAIEKDQFVSLYEELRFLREFLKDSEEKRYEHEKVRNLVAQIADVAYEAEVMVDLLVLRKDRSMAEKIGPLQLSGVMKEINFIKTQVVEIYEKKMFEIGVPQTGRSSDGGSARVNSSIVEEETVVGFDDETTAILEMLTREHEKQLKVIQIVGMAGLGKTTLAKKVYNDSFVVYHFYIRAWTYVSQVYREKDLLVGILRSAHIQLTGKIEEMSDEKLGERLYKGLKGKRYFIVMDDIWDTGAWDDLKIFFPNDNNGSRIMFTSRPTYFALHAKVHPLRFLTEEESWDLLRNKVFRKESCPLELMKIGQKIAKKCQGLPLAILVVAGLLAKEDKTLDWWKQVAERVSSYIVSDPEQYMGTLGLSYNHLPHHLKACFLYFGVFPEDYEISVWKLIYLWVAEGFIRRNEQKSLEEVAEDYLMDLIDRSLVVVSKRRSSGGIKTCRIHDLLRDLCLRKAQEENFLQQISRNEDASSLSSSPIATENFLQQISRNEDASSSSSSPIATKHRRLCIHSPDVDYTSLKPYASHAPRSFLSFVHYTTTFLGNDDLVSFCQAFKLLRVLDLTSMQIPFFSNEIGQLVHLRYLGLYLSPDIDGMSFRPSISNLLNLEILNVVGNSWGIDLPDDIWKMVKLRHLCTIPLIKIPRVPNVYNLQTIGNLLFPEDVQALATISNLRKLKCTLFTGHSHFPKLDFLIHLQTLNVSKGDRWSLVGPKRFLSLDKFPQNLKKLTLSEFNFPWMEMSTLGKLPNLEVLKLLYYAFRGPQWDTTDGDFPKLKFLKFKLLNIVQWNASSNQFPNLQRLVLDECEQLKEIPSGLGDLSTLEMIELRRCSYSLANSVRQIQEKQQSMGNDGLKIVMDRCWDEIEESVEDELLVDNTLSRYDNLKY